MRKPWEPVTAALIRERARWPWGSWPPPDKGPQQETPPQPEPKPAPKPANPAEEIRRAEARSMALTLHCAAMAQFTTTAGPWPD